MAAKNSFTSEALDNGMVRLTFYRTDDKATVVEIPAEAIPLVACKMLQDAQTASGAPVKAESLSGLPALNPAALGLSSVDERFPTALVVHMGKARFGVLISTPRDLGHALIAASADGRSQ